MKPQTSYKLAQFGMAGVFSAISFGLVFWLVEGNVWLKLILGVALADALEASTRLADLSSRVDRFMDVFQIADNQLVKVSADIDRHNEMEAEWNEIAELKRRIETLEDQLNERYPGWNR